VKKRILIVTQYFWPENFRVNELATELSKKGHKLDVLTGIPNYPLGYTFHEFKKNPHKYYKYNEIKIYRARHWLRGSNKLSLLLNYISFPIFASIYAIFLAKKTKYDLVLGIQLSPIFSIFPGVILKKFFKIPLYVWILDIWPDSIQATNKHISKPLLKTIEKICKKIYSSANALFLTSKGFEKRLIEMNIDHRKLIYLPQWVERDYKRTNTNSKKIDEVVKRIISKWPNKKIFLFAGNIGEAQDFYSILSGFKDSDSKNKWVFLILGDGRYKSKLLKHIPDLNLEENVFYLGSFPSEYMPIFYNYADFLIFSLMNLPIFSLTLPGKVQSYMSSGTPILGMVNGEAARVIKEAECGITVPSGDVHAFSKMINSCLILPDYELQKFGLNGIDFAIKEYDSKKIINKFEKSII
jgi:colanic acid biosynthesis glycosyl transferase WcaI